MGREMKSPAPLLGGKMINKTHTFHASEETGTGAYVITGVTNLNVREFLEGTFFINCTAIDVATTLDCKIQTLDTLSSSWLDLVAFTQIATINTPEKKTVATNLGAVLRATYSITNSKKATFTVSVLVKG